MRLLAVTVLVAMLTGCTCGGCQKKSETPRDAGQFTEVTNVDAGETAITAATDEPDGHDASVALPEAVGEFGPSPDAAIALFVDDCRAPIDVTFEDIDGTQKMFECDARYTEPNSSPDSFSCWAFLETCRDECGQPCKSCQAVCGDRCESCKSECDGGACITTCAATRNECRVSCLQRLETCRSKQCLSAFQRCEDDGRSRVARLCPDCQKIIDCQTHALERDQDPHTCSTKFPSNAAECLEWCTPGQ